MRLQTTFVSRRVRSPGLSRLERQRRSAVSTQCGQGNSAPLRALLAAEGEALSFIVQMESAVDDDAVAFPYTVQQDALVTEIIAEVDRFQQVTVRRCLNEDAIVVALAHNRRRGYDKALLRSVDQSHGCQHGRLIQ